MFSKIFELEFSNHILDDNPSKNVGNEWCVTFYYKLHFWQKFRKGVVSKRTAENGVDRARQSILDSLDEYRQSILDGVEKSFRKVVNTHPDNKLTPLYAKITFYKWKAHILSVMAQGDIDGLSRIEIIKQLPTSAITTENYRCKDNVWCFIKELIMCKLRYIFGEN